MSIKDIYLLTFLHAGYSICNKLYSLVKVYICNQKSVLHGLNQYGGCLASLRCFSKG